MKNETIKKLKEKKCRRDTRESVRKIGRVGGEMGRKGGQKPFLPPHRRSY